MALIEETLRHIQVNDLKSLYLSPDRIADDDLEEAGRIIMANTSIKSVSLWDFHEADVAKYQPLFLGISQNNSIISIDVQCCDVCEGLSRVFLGKCISSLSVERCNINVDVLVAVLQTKALTPQHIETLQLASLDNTEHDLTLIIQACIGPTSTLRTFLLYQERGIITRDISITDTVLLSLAEALRNNSTLEHLVMDSCRFVTSVGWLALSRVLGSSRSHLKKLSLWNSSINDDVINDFANELGRNTTLETIDLGNCEHITTTGWLAFSRLLGNSYSGLREIEVSNSSINDAVVAAFVNELSRNQVSQLKRLAMFSFYNDTSSTNRIWDLILNLLCDTSSIDATWLSNHIICDLGEFDIESDQDSDDRYFMDTDVLKMPDQVLELLNMNLDEDKTRVARTKVIKHHFSEDFDVNALIGSDQKLLPRKISWLGRDSLGLSIVYKIIRTLPDLCQNDQK